MNNTIATIKDIITDIEYLRSHGTYPWAGASGRRAMENRYSYSKRVFLNDQDISVDITTSASCRYVRFSVTVVIDGVEQKQYLRALKKLVA